MKYLLLILLPVLMVITGCETNSEDYHATATVDNINSFTFDMLPHLYQGNTFFSPYSIYSNLGLVHGGAKGKTKKEIVKVLTIDNRKQRVHPSLHQIERQLEQRVRVGITLKTANAIWLDKDVNVERRFHSLTNQYYDGAINIADFSNEPEKSRMTINEWIEGKTEGKIQNMLPEGTIKADSRFILTNAIYFLGKWQDVFEKKDTNQDIFFTKPGEAYIILFMNRTGDYLYYANEEYQVLELPYKGEELSMVIILPQEDNNLEKLMNNFSYKEYSTVIDSLIIREVKVSIPRFRIETKYQLRDLFISLGSSLAFTESADFSGISDYKPGLMIDDIYHQAYVDVKEEGTEAAVVTANILLMRFSANLLTPVFKADRPFLFLIRDRVTDVILFAGILEYPGGVKVEAPEGEQIQRFEPRTTFEPDGGKIQPRGL